MFFLTDMNTSLSCNQPSFNGIEKFLQTKVDDKLLRGSCVTSPLKVRKMKKEGITQIIDLRNSAHFESPLEKLFCKIFGIKYVNYRFSHRLNDIPDQDFFKKVNESILSNEGKTYMHCEYGRHRTGLAVAIYEKLHTQKDNSEIIKNMIDNGYTEIMSKGETKKEKKYINQYNQMMDMYF